MTHSSQGDKVSGRDGASTIDRLLLFQNNQEDNLNEPSNNDFSGEDTMSKVAVNFLLELVNETFLSIPIIDCKRITRIQVEQEQDSSLEHNNYNANQNYNACFVDWPKIKLVQNPTNNAKLNYSTLKTQASEILLSNLFESNSILNSPESLSSIGTPLTEIKHLNDNVSNVYNPPLFETINNNSNSTIDSYYHIAKLTYLSVSTILSICGALINLFIIFIIIFNTKQKRISLIRGNTIGQNNLLLFQLTLTGLLLAGYVLIDNFSIQYETKTWNNIYSFSQTTTNIQDDLSVLDFQKYTLSERRQDELFQKSIRNDISPQQLSSFLPPTLFYPNNKLLCNTFTRNTLPTRYNSHESNLRTQNGIDDDIYYMKETTNDHQPHVFSLIFTYSADRNYTKFDDLNGNDKSQWLGGSNNITRLKIWYLSSGGDSDSDSDSNYNFNLIDLHEELESISIADTSCNNLLDKESSGKERKSRHTYIKQQQEPAKVPIYLNINYSNKFIRLYIFSLISFMMNVVASVHIWTVAALAYDRYCAIAHPLQYLRSIHASRTKTFLVVSWILSIILNILLPAFMNQINNLGSARQLKNEPCLSKGFEAKEEWFTWSALNEDRISDSEGIESITNINDDRNYGYKNKEECQFIVKKMTQQETMLKDLNHLTHILNKFLEYRTKINNVTFREHDSSYDKNFNSEQKVKREKLKMKFIINISIKFIELSSKLMKLQDSIQNMNDIIKINQANRTTFIALLIVFSLSSFVIIIIIPLLIISVCNISIYRIVKGHERRLSVSSNNNNNSTSISNAYNNNNCNNCSNSNQRFGHNLKKQAHVDDERAESNSVTSLLFNRLFKANFAQKSLSHPPESASYIQEQESCDFQQQAQNKCLLKCDKNCDCDKLANNKLEYHNKSESQPNIVNRSKRLISRRDSYQVLAKSNGEELQKRTKEFNDKERNCGGRTKVSSSCDSILSDQNQQASRAKLKRKVSDNAPLYYSRKSSNTSHTEDLDTDTRSYIDTPITMYFDGIKYESGSIMNQLKMAGLSFAGIAIRKSFGVQRNTLQKSCSLCNIYKQHYHHGSSISRCSVETSASSNCYKHSKYLNSTYKYQDHQNNKFACQLADNDSDNLQHIASNSNLIFHPHNGRLPSTFGTKSSAFNVVIWLILTMLVFALLHFLLITVDRLARLNVSRDLELEEIKHNENEFKFYSQQLETVLKFILESKVETLNSGISEARKKLIPATNICKNEQSFVQLSSLWLSCLCRILFLGMVPLNGWLYGVKSRSLRTKIRIVLKRYINEKQASIEINKRQRSVSSMRSRDSSLVNLQSINSHQNSCCNCNYNRADRSFRRCSSFGTTIRHTDTSNYLRNARSLQSQVHLINSVNSDSVVKSTKIPNDTSIKFVIGEYNADNSCSSNQAQNVSISSSLTSDHRSMLPTNTGITASDFTLLEKKCSSLTDSESQSFNQSDLESKFTDVMNRFEPSNSDHDRPLVKRPKLVDTTGVASNTNTYQDNSISNSLPKGISNTQLFLANNASNQTPRPVRPNEFDLGELSCNQKSLTTDFRHSNAELSSSNDDYLLDRNVKKSTSDFKLIVTPIEQRAEKHDECRSQLEEGLLDKKSSIDSSCCTDDKLNQSNQFVKRKPLRTFSNWCMELRHNLTKVLSAVILNNSPSSIPPIEDGQFSVVDFDSCRCELTSRGSVDSSIGSQDQSRVGLLKRAGLETDCHSNSTYNWVRNLSYSNNPSKSPIRASYTMSNIDMKMKRYEDCNLKYCCPKHQSSHSKGSFCEKTKRSNSIIEQSQTFLKPPSFLKLIFDPNNSAATYSSSSALSPIKECSSNQHSYASSQSSLNNSQIQQQHRKLSLNDLSPKASLAPTTIVKQIGSENKFETRLVKDVKGE